MSFCKGIGFFRVLAELQKHSWRFGRSRGGFENTRPWTSCSIIISLLLHLLFVLYNSTETWELYCFSSSGEWFFIYTCQFLNRNKRETNPILKKQKTNSVIPSSENPRGRAISLSLVLFCGNERFIILNLSSNLKKFRLVVDHRYFVVERKQNSCWSREIWKSIGYHYSNWILNMFNSIVCNVQYCRWFSKIHTIFKIF